MSDVDAAAAQAVDVFFTFVHEAADQSVVAEDDAGHLGDVLVTLVLADVATVIHQAGHQVAPPSLLLVTFLYLKVSDTRRVFNRIRIVLSRSLTVCVGDDFENIFYYRDVCRCNLKSCS